jgi:hypothetical protein
MILSLACRAYLGLPKKTELTKAKFITKLAMSITISASLNPRIFSNKKFQHPNQL